MGVASSTCIIPGSEYDAGIQWQRDVDKAKELLAEAGWDPNATLTMAIGSSRESMAAVIQQNLAEAGIKVDIQTVEVATMFSGLRPNVHNIIRFPHCIFIMFYYNKRISQIPQIF